MGWTRATEGSIRLGDRLRIEGSADGEYRIVAITRYEVPGEPDDDWVEFTATPWSAQGGDREREVHLATTDGGGWAMFDELGDDAFDDPVWHDVVYKGKVKPPRTMTLYGMPFRAGRDDHHYKVRVREERQQPDGSVDTDEYKARITDYDDGTPVAGSEVSLELWNGGRSLSMGRPLTSIVEVWRG